MMSFVGKKFLLFSSLCCFLFSSLFAGEIKFTLVSNNVLHQTPLQNYGKGVTHLLSGVLSETSRLSYIDSYQDKFKEAQIVCLQEDQGGTFSGKIQSLKPGVFQLIKQNPNADVAIIYDKTVFEIVGEVSYGFASSGFNEGPYVLVTLRHKVTGKQVAVINTHLKGGPGYSGQANSYVKLRIDQINTIKTKIPSDMPTVLCGDFNLNASPAQYDEFMQATQLSILGFSNVDEKLQTPSCTVRVSPVKDPTDQPQRLDYIFYKGMQKEEGSFTTFPTFDQLISHKTAFQHYGYHSDHAIMKVTFSIDLPAAGTTGTTESFNDPNNYYAVLGIPNDSSKDTIRKAYKKLSVKYHPDKHKDESEKYTEIFKIIKNAYDKLIEAIENPKNVDHGKQSPPQPTGQGAALVFNIVSHNVLSQQRYDSYFQEWRYVSGWFGSPLQSYWQQVANPPVSQKERLGLLNRYHSARFSSADIICLQDDDNQYFAENINYSPQTFAYVGNNKKLVVLNKTNVFDLINSIAYDLDGEFESLYCLFQHKATGHRLGVLNILVSTLNKHLVGSYVNQILYYLQHWLVQSHSIIVCGDFGVHANQASFNWKNAEAALLSKQYTFCVNGNFAFKSFFNNKPLQAEPYEQWVDHVCCKGLAQEGFSMVPLPNSLIRLPYFYWDGVKYEKTWSNRDVILENIKHHSDHAIVSARFSFPKSSAQQSGSWSSPGGASSPPPSSAKPKSSSPPPKSSSASAKGAAASSKSGAAQLSPATSLLQVMKLKMLKLMSTVALPSSASGAGSGASSFKKETRDEKAKYMHTILNNVLVIVVENDITKFSFDNWQKAAIVNAANTGLQGGGGVDGAIHKAAGQYPDPKDTKKFKSKLAAAGKFDVGGSEVSSGKTGEAYISDACDLGTGQKEVAQYVIHAIGPMGEDPVALKSAYTRSLQLAQQKGLTEICFPGISTGIFGYSVEKATPVALDAIDAFLRANKTTTLRRIYLIAQKGEQAWINAFKKALSAHGSFSLT
ncbi:MAG: macro domain-containing protein [Epsilonproteobacteria bacterium]|nr:macro domain-containing protein [Campylobacterota bacterium]